MFKTELTPPVCAISAALLLTLCAEASVIYSRIQIDARTVTDLGNVSVYGGRGVSQAFNGSGMSADWTTHINNSGNNYWMITVGSTSVACALIPLPADSNRIDRIVIFGCNWLNGTSDLSSRSVKAFSVWYGDAEVASAAEVREKYTKIDLGVDELPQPVGAPANYTGVTFDLSQQISAKYLAILPTSGYDNFYVSVGEVVLYEKFVISDGKAELENPGLLKTADGQLAVTGTVRDAAAFVGYAATADGGETWYGRLTDEPVAADAAFSVAVTTEDLEQERIYEFSAVVENENGAVTNFVGRAYVGTALADWNVWMADPKSTCQASVPDHWTKGAVPGIDPAPLMLHGAISDADIRWTAGENGLPADVLPPIRCVDYAGTLFVSSSASLTFAPGDEPLTVGGMRLSLAGGNSYANAREFKVSGGVVTVTNEFLDTTRTFNRFVLADGAVFSSQTFHAGLDAAGSRSNTVVRVGKGCFLGVEGEMRFQQRTALVVEGAASVGSLILGSNSTDLGVDGGSFTNLGTMVVNKNDVGAGAIFAVRDGGRFVQHGEALFDGGQGGNIGPGLMTLSRGGVFEAWNALSIGNPARSHPDNMNVLTLADAETRLTAPSLTVADSCVRVKLPVGSAGESCVTIAGTASFVGASCVEIDLAGAASGRYEILSADSLEGLTPEKVTLVGQLPPRHSARLVLTDRRLAVIVTSPGLSVLLR